MSQCYCGSLVVFLRSPLLSTSPAPSWCVCPWVRQQQQQQQQQSGTPVIDQLITLQLYLPGLSTTSALDYYVPCGNFTVPLSSLRQSVPASAPSFQRVLVSAFIAGLRKVLAFALQRVSAFSALQRVPAFARGSWSQLALVLVVFVLWGVWKLSLEGDTVMVIL